MAVLDLVDWPADQPLRVSGSPSSLWAPVTIHPPPDQPLAVPQVTLVNVKDPFGRMLLPRSIGIMRGQIRMRLDPTTPPGHYEGAIEIGGVARSIQIDIVENVEVSIRPSALAIDLTLGLSQRVAIAIENRGNVPLTIDLAGVYPLGEEIPIFPERIDHAEGDAIERLANLFERTIGARKQRAMHEVGTIALAMSEGSVRVEPGAAQTIAFSVSLPEGLSSTGRFRAFVPIYMSDLELVVVTATKQAPPKERPRPRGRGVST